MYKFKQIDKHKTYISLFTQLYIDSIKLSSCATVEKKNSGQKYLL